MSPSKKAAPRPCSCPEHAVNAPTKLGVNHHYTLDDDPNRIFQWNWKCGCGRHGRAQMQSPSVSYHAWLEHVEREKAKGR